MNDQAMLEPRTVYRVWHENGDFEGEYHSLSSARVASALCECTHVQTVKVYPDGSEYDATGHEF